MGASGKADVSVVSVEEATEARTAQLTDAGKVVEFTHANGGEFTVPANSSVPFAPGVIIGLYAENDYVTIVEDAGVTVVNLTDVAPQQEVSLRYRGNDEWVEAG